MKTELTWLCAGLILALLVPKAGATNQYYDDSGTGAPSGGTWDTTHNYWTSSTTLTTSTVPFTNGNTAIFAAGTNNTSAQTVTVNSAITCAGITNLTFTNGLTFSGTGSIGLSSGAQNIYCGSVVGITINVPVTGTGGIVQHGNGYLALNATNTYSGGTLMTGGQVIYYYCSGSFGTGPVTNSSSPGSAIVNNTSPEVALNISNNFYWASGSTNALNLAGGNPVGGLPGTTFWGSFNLQNGGNATVLNTSSTATEVIAIAAPITGSGAVLTVADDGTLWLAGTNTFTGGLTISSPATLIITNINVTNCGSLGAGSYAANITNNSTFIYGSSINQTLSGSISGSGTLTEDGPGTLTLTGANTYTGVTTVNGGGLYASAAGAIPSASLTVNGGTVDASVSGAIASSSVTVNGGVLELDSTMALSSPIVVLTLAASPANGTIDLTFPAGTPQYVEALYFGTNSQAPGTWGATGSGADNTSSVFTGPGMLIVGTSTSAIAYWDPGSSPTAPGTGGNGSWDNLTHDWLVGSTVQQWVTGDAAEFAGLAGTVTVNTNIVPGALYFATAGYVVTNGINGSITLSNTVTPVTIPSGTTTIAAPITGEGMVVSGPGTLFLTGVNTYAAGTTVSNSATLSVAALSDVSGPVGAGTVTLDGGSTLAYTGNGSSTGRQITIGPGATTATLNVPAGNTLNLNGHVSVVGNTAAQALTFTGGGTLNLGGNSLDNGSLTMNIKAGTVVINKTNSNNGHGLGGGTSIVGPGALLQLGANSTGGQDLYSGNVLTVQNGGTFDLNGITTQGNTLNIMGNYGVTNSSTTAGWSQASSVVLGQSLSLGGNGGITLSGPVSGPGGDFSLTWNPVNTNAVLTLGGASTFIGGLTIAPSCTVQISNAAGAGTGPVNMGAGSTFAVNIAGNTLGNPINGPSSAIVNIIETSGNNTQINSDMSAFTGTLNCPAAPGPSAAKVQIGNTDFSINPAATINVAAGGTFYLFGASAVVIPCTVNFYGTGNSEAYGALRIERNPVISGAVHLYGNTTFGNGVSGQAYAGVISGVISSPTGAYGITFTPEPGTIVLSGANTYTGTTTLNSASTGSPVVELASPELGTGGPLGEPSPSANTLICKGGALQFTPVNTYDYSSRFSSSSTAYVFDDNGQTVTFASPITGTASLTNSSTAPNGVGKLILSAANTYTGVTTLAGAQDIVELNAVETAGTSGPLGKPATLASSIVLGGATLQFTSVNQYDYSSRFSSSSTAYNMDVNGYNVTFGSALAGSGLLTLYSSSAGGTLSLGGSNTYTGTTYIYPGCTLNISGQGSLGYVAAGPNKYAGAIRVDGALNFATASNNLLTGAIFGAGSLTQSGTGTLILSSAETYYGGTIVSAGTLVISNSASVQGNVTVTGGTLVCSNASALISAATLTLPTSSSLGTAALNYAGTMTISALYFGTAPQPAGTYGAVGSGAQYPSAYFTGTGFLSVGSGSAYWDPGNPAQLDAAPGSGGNGSWDNTVSSFWYNGTAGDVLWNTISGAIPTFAGAPGTVTLNAGVTADGLAFTTAGYTLSGGNPLTLSGALGNTTPIITIPAGLTTIGCTIASGLASNTVIISGPGTLALNGLNTFTNPITVTGGATLSFNTLSDSQPCSLGPLGIFGANASTNIITMTSANLSFNPGSPNTTVQTYRNVSLNGALTDTINVPTGDTLDLESKVGVGTDSAPYVLTFTGGGTLILGGTAQDNNSLTMNILAGTVQINKATSGSGHGLGGGTTAVASGATLMMGGPNSSGVQPLYSGCILLISNGGVFDLAGQSDSMSTLYIAGNGSGNGALINSGYNQSFLTNSGGIWLTGNTTIGGSTTEGSITLASTIEAYNGIYSLTYAASNNTILYLQGANTYEGGLNIAGNSTVEIQTTTAAGSGPINIGPNATLIISNGLNSPLNELIGTSSSTIEVATSTTANTFIGGSLVNFTGTIHCQNLVSGNNAGQVVINNQNNEAYPPPAAANWNIDSQVTLDLATPFTNDPASVTVNGIGGNAYGNLRLDACNQQGNVTLNSATSWIGSGNTTYPSTISGVIQGGGGLVLVTGTTPITMILTAANTYYGATVVSNANILALSGSGSIANSSSLLLQTNTVFNVSGVSGGYTFGSSSSQLLTNLGTATITGNLTLGANASLGLNGTNALVVTNGTLNLNNNPVTVAVSGTPGANGYLLVQGANGGSVAGNVGSSPLTAYVNGVLNNNFYLTMIGGSLYMAPGPVSILSGPNPQNPTVYSNSVLTFNFSVSVIGAPTLTNQWYVNGAAVPGATSTNFTLTLNNSTLGSTTVTFGSTNSFSPGGVSASTIVTVIARPTLSYASNVVALNPLGYWRLNEPGVNGTEGGPNNGVVCNDYISGNNGTYTNTELGWPGYDTFDSTLPADPNYDNETCAFFGQYNSPNSCVYGIPTNVDVSVPTNTSATFTIQAWVQCPNGQMPDTINTPTIAAKGYYYNEEFTLDCGNHIGSYAAYRFTVRNAGGTIYGVSSPLIAGADANWHYLVGVCDEVHSNIAFYIDSTNVGTAAIPAGSGIVFSNVNVPMTIGARSSSATAGYDQQFTGNINDVALFTNALTASQVQNLYYQAGIPAVATYPSNSVTIYVNEYDTLVFPSYTNGTPPLTIQWYVTDNITNATTALVGQTNATLVYSNIPGWVSTLYEVVSNAYGGQSNLVNNVYVYTGAPNVSGPTPSSVTVPVGAQVTYSVSVTGADTPFLYQWYAGYQTASPTEINGATNASYTVTALQGTNYYGCYVTNTSGYGQSQQVQVNGTIAPTVLNFNNPSLWSLNEQATRKPTLANGILEITSAAGSESGSAFYTIPQYIASGFVASYVYTPSQGTATRADGTAFVIQNSASTYTADGGGGGQLGISGISPSVAFIMDLYTGSVGGTGINWSTNGAAASGSPVGAPNGGTAPVNINSLDPIQVTITYTPANSNVQVNLQDLETYAAFSTNYRTGNLAAMLGSADAYVGFAGATGGDDAQQDITSFTFAYTSANEGPAILTDITPTNMDAPVGASITYSVVALGTAPLYYQWYLNGSNSGNAILNATNSAYTFAAVAGNNTYQCIVSNVFGGTNLAFSSVATVSAALTPPAVTFSTPSLWQLQGSVFTPTLPTGGPLTVTTAANSEGTSSYYTIPQYINNGFVASFTYTPSGGSSTRADGTAFVLQNSVGGPYALGLGGGGLGVSGTAPCVNVNLDIYSGASGGTGLGFGTNGSSAEEAGAANVSTSPVNINGGDAIQVTIAYHPETGLGYVTLVDPTASTSFATTVPLGNLSLLTGGDAVYVGFTGGTGSDTSIQTIQNFSFSLVASAAAILQDLTPLTPQLYVGDSITYSVIATGDQPISYEWLVNGTAVPGATGPSYTLTVPSGTTTVQCGVSNSYSANVYAMSSTASITGVTPPTDPYATNVLALGPVAYWRLNEAQGSTVAYDYAGGHNGTYGTDTTNGQPGIPNPPFNGFPAPELGVWMDNGAGITTTAGCVATTSSNIAATNMTITGWVYPSATNANSTGVIFARTGGYGYGINMGSAEYFSYTWANNASTYDWTSGLYIPPNQWSFLALVVTPNNAIAYVFNTNSGMISATNAVANTSLVIPASFTIGADTTSLPARTFNGEMDEVAIFTNALTTAQLVQMYSLASNAVTTVPAAFSSLASPSITYGTASVTLTGTVSGPGSVYPANTESVSATINGYTVNGSVINGTGGFSITYNNASLATDGLGSYPITYAYAGDSSLIGVTNSSATLTITALTRPTITSATLTGTSLVISATNGTHNGTYRLMETTNLAAPENWTAVMTGSFDAYGNVTLTNTINPSIKQEFFSIQNP